MVRAECPWYQRVLGGEALISGAGAAGKVAIQGAFPMYDAGLTKWVFVAKAAEEAGNASSWSVTAVAYCTTSPEAPIYVQASSAFDSEPVKHVEVTCPFPMKVVGMGGEVTKLDGDPLADVASIPSTDLVFHGMEADSDARKVSAGGIEFGGLLGGTFAGNWKVTAVAACAREAYYEGLEVRIMRISEGGPLGPDDSAVMVACSPGKEEHRGGRVDGRGPRHGYVVPTSIFTQEQRRHGGVRQGVSQLERVVRETHCLDDMRERMTADLFKRAR